MEELSNKNKKALLKEIPALKTDHCLDINLIGLYLEKKLSAGESGKVEEHIKECLYCLDQLNGLHEMILFEKTPEALTQKQQERFAAIFQEKVKREAKIHEPATGQPLFDFLGQILKRFTDTFSSLNFGWKTALAMVLITITSVYFNFRMVNPGYEGSRPRISSRISHEVKNSGVKVSLLDESGKQIRETAGFVINSNGLILTNLNEMTQAHSAQVTLNDGTSYPVEGVQPDGARNLALLKINRKNLIPLKGTQSTDVKVGENLIQIGDPSDPSGTTSLATVTNYISSSRKTSSGQQYVQFVNQSSSQKKGILINQAGEAIGMVISRQENISYGILLKPGDVQGIAGDFKPVASIDSKLPNIGEALGFYFKGILAYDAMDYQKATTYFRQAIDLNPNLDGARVWLGTLYNDQGKLDLEVREYEEALKINPKNIDARYYLARAKDEQGLYDDGIQEFEKALQIDPKDKDTLYELGIDYVTQGQWEKAQEQYEILKNIDPGNSRKLLKLIGMLGKKKGN